MGTRHLPLVLLAVLCGPPGGPPASAATAEQPRTGEDNLYRNLALYTEVLALVGRAYVEETDAASLTLASLEGAVDAVDPFSLYIPAAEVDAYLAARAVARDRSGLLILKERRVAYVAAVDEGSPAARVGVERGQIIDKLQGRQTRGMPLWRIRQLLGATAGTPLELDLIASYGEKSRVRFELEEFAKARPRVETVREVPVLRLPGFSDQTPTDVDRALLDVEEDKLIIDLRGVAGGDPAAAYGVAERFADGELGILAGRNGPLRSFAGPVPPTWSGSLAVLVDRGTQGAAEILATVLRQACGAQLVGARTFGHAGKTESIGLSSGARLELTGSFYTGPDREPLSSALQPDLWIRPGSAPTAGDRTDQPERDEILDRAVDLLLQSGP